MKITKVGIAGCGIMGSGIAQVCALAGYETVVREVNQNLLDRGLDKLRASLGKSVDREQITQEEMDEALHKIHGTINLEEFSGCDLIIEAIVEDLDEKRELFGALEEVCDEMAIFASNTSSLTITDMASVSENPARFVGLHFFNPVPRMPLVEVVRSLETTDEVFAAAFGFAEDLGKKPIECKDNSGFVVNLLLVPYMLDAIRAVENGVAGIKDIDQGMELGAGHPMGPLTLLDFVGLDTTYHIADIMFNEYREKRYAPPPLLKKMVQSGMYGKKSGRGFYDYSGEEPTPADLNF
ncbi:MAG: 3-hydroxybutyryl-CoA dehydrogenase [Candidatus Marinimicrobia bacterium]|nr:3-hydroxybutyryl-CoA dehydrogenase [Candidatus Neomarinimicrobiota bacterium]MCF7827673.1 3-hydroxybutyryl-CoA dehydrogenase [Candidatus Neomarinimicrobiota bacterium]MCF7881272.1 3-hydroxybutyryl-CoA dehydrogenase [Candidatus Neomarinimicrobiota bacterium]